MKITTVLIICASFLIFSCKKDKKDAAEPELINTDLRNGFPDDKNAINGYLYISVKSIGNSFPINMYATFNDPAKDLLPTYDHFYDYPLNNSISGNVSVGNAIFNGVTLMPNSFGNRLYYVSSNSYLGMRPSAAHWKTTGNSSFIAIDMDVSRNFPVLTGMNTSQLPDTLNVQNGFSFNVTNKVSNYDSVTVALTSNNQVIRKTVAPGKTDISFTSHELKSVFFSNQYGSMTIAAYNYSNKTIDSKVYLFELSSKSYTNLYLKF